MNIFRGFASKGVKGSEGGKKMKEMIVIRALENGLWEIQVLVRKGKDEFIERGKICKI